METDIKERKKENKNMSVLFTFDDDPHYDHENITYSGTNTDIKFKKKKPAESWMKDWTEEERLAREEAEREAREEAERKAQEERDAAAAE